MHFTRLHRLLSLSILLSLLIAIPAAAGKRRSVKSAEPGVPQITATITGTVVDAGTGAPVVSAEVRGGGKAAYSGTDGKFRLKDASGFGSIVVTAERSGYTMKSATVTGAGAQQITIQLNPTPTVRVRKTNNTTYDLDLESLLFGYVLTFGGYSAASFDEFCRTDGSQVTIDRVEMKKITGPATKVTQATCCAGQELMKVNVQLKNGTTQDVVFHDSCFGYRVDLVGREHVSANFQYIPFTEIAEVVFP
jgi:hypothetical protein